MKKQVYILLLIFLLIPTWGFSQQVELVTVTGLVEDADGEPLIGVNIVVKDQVNMGTITDFNGNFSLRAVPYSTLVISYVGFERQEVNIGNQTTLKIVMKNQNVLDEVIVTAAGVQKKISSTGAITTVNVDDLRVSSPNLTNSLIGNVPGILARQGSGEPGNNSSEFWIRGISTFGANQSALVLVDGFERPFNEINIEDIESFSVLKDASATAIYGAKGANGVVLINTKRGKAGKVNINVKAEYGYKTRTRTPKFVDGVTYAGMVNEALETRNREPLYSAEEIDMIRYQLDPDLYPNVDWMDLLLRDGANTYRVSVNFDGGGTTARYFVSGSYVEEGGMYKVDQTMKDYNTNANYNRWNYRTNFDMDLTSTTLVSVGVSGFLEKQNRPGLGNDDIWNSLVGTNPVAIPIMYSDGKVPAYGTGNKTNPWVLATQTGFGEHWKSVSQVNLSLKQDLKFITEGLRFEARAGLDTESENDIKRSKHPDQYKAKRRRDMEGELVFDRIATGEFMKQTAWSGGTRFFNVETEFHYNRTFDKHRVGGLLKYFQNEKRTTVDIGEDKIKGIPFRNMGFSGRFTYGFMDRYMLEFNFGYTGSETFKPGHQFGFFPAISGGWNIAEEKFIKEALPWLSIAKVRYSYGLVGNDYIGKDNNRVRFPYRNEFGEDGNGYIFSDYSADWNQIGRRYFSKVAAENLGWEVAKKHNIGFDLNILNSLFTFTVDVFKDTREDIYLERAYLSSMVGVPSDSWANVGKMQSQGVDGHFGFSHRIGEVNFTLRGNVTYAHNEVLEFDEESNVYPYRMTEGYRYNQVKGLIALGLFKDYDDIRNSPAQHFGSYEPGDVKYKDVNGDGVINDEDKVAIGSTETPNLVYGVGLSAHWNGFDFNIHFQGAGNCSRMIKGPSVRPFVDGDWGNIFVEAADPANRWISSEISKTTDTERTDALYPRLSYGGHNNNYQDSSFWLRDSKYVRLKTLEIGYAIPKKILSNLGMTNARVFFLGNNLALWDSLKLWDPELDTDNGMKYPIAKSFTVGLSVNF